MINFVLELATSLNYCICRYPRKINSIPKFLKEMSDVGTNKRSNRPTFVATKRCNFLLIRGQRHLNGIYLPTHNFCVQFLFCSRL